MDYILEVMGWIGSMLLAFCAVPQAIESWRKKSSKGIAWGFIAMWGAGEVLTMIYVWPKSNLPLLFNYLTNIVLLFVIMYYKIRYK